MKNVLLACALLVPCLASAALPSRPQASPADLKLDGAMRGVADAAAMPLVPGPALAKKLNRQLGGLVRVNDAMEVQAYVHLLPGFAGHEALLAKEGARIERSNAKRNVVQAWIAASDLRRLSQLPYVRRIGKPAYAQRRAGSEITEGDSIVGGPETRALGVDGEGVRVGVISDGIVGIEDAQDSGDVPEDVTVIEPGCDTFNPLCSVVDEYSCSEGVAMLEIIHDIAPAAELAFCAPNTSLDMVDCIDRLRTEFGADVIVDDLIFFDEPFFEDGDIALAALDAVDAGVIYASAAGNEQFNNYFEGDYFAVAINDPDYDSQHDFGRSAGFASDVRNPILVEENDAALVLLQWNDPWGTATNDYDLFLFDTSSDELLAASVEDQATDGLPFEGVCWFNDTGANQTVQIEVARLDGSANRHLKLLNSCSRGLCQLTYASDDGAIVGHAAANGVLAVGAVFEGSPSQIEVYSSRGPSRIDFPSLVFRSKPDLVAPDCVSVTGAGDFPPTFCGTSAAAPHVAAVAALLRSAFDGNTSSDDIVAAMEDTAVDLGPAGFDKTYGHGRVDAYEALLALDEDTTPPPSGGGGGGGSLSLLSSLALLTLVGLRRRR